MACHYPDLRSASDWLKQISQAARPIRSTTQIWVVTRHQYGISALASRENQLWRRQMSAVFSGYNIYEVFNLLRHGIEKSENGRTRSDPRYI